MADFGRTIEDIELNILKEHVDCLVVVVLDVLETPQDVYILVI